MPDNESMGLRLKRQRRQLKLSRSRMAEETGITVDRLARLEAGKGLLYPAEIVPLLRGYSLLLEDWLPIKPDSGVLPAPLWLLTDGERQALARFVETLVAGRAAPA